MDETLNTSPEIGPETLFCTALEQLGELRGKVYPSGALQNAAAPFSFYEQIAEDEEEALDGYTGLMISRFRIHVVASNYSALCKLSRKVRVQLQRLQGSAPARGDAAVAGVAAAGKALPGADAAQMLLEQVTVRQSSPDLWERDVGLYRRVYELELHWQAV